MKKRIRGLIQPDTTTEEQRDSWVNRPKTLDRIRRIIRQCIEDEDKYDGFSLAERVYILRLLSEVENILHVYLGGKD